MTTRTTLLSIIVAVAGLAGDVRAECRTGDQTKPVAFHMAKVGGKLTMVIEDNIVICGHVPRPAVAIVPSPTTSEYVWETLEQKLLPKIVDAVKQAPFSGGSR